MVLCEKEGELGSVVVVAEDKDQVPLSAPFSFTLPADHDNKWSLILENGKCLYFYYLILKYIADFNMLVIKTFWKSLQVVRDSLQ